MWKRVFAILHLCPDPKLAFLRFYTYVRTATKIENAFLRFYTYVRTQHSHFCDSTPMSGPKTCDFAIMHFCPHMDAASAHLDASLTQRDFLDLAKPGPLVLYTSREEQKKTKKRCVGKTGARKCKLQGVE